MGDRVLQTVAQVMVECSRKSDIVARFGGEEFVILFPCTDKESAIIACEHIRESIESYPWDDICTGMTVTISIGVCDASSCKSIGKMLTHADGALYAAKDSGRNKVLYADS